MERLPEDAEERANKTTGGMLVGAYRQRAGIDEAQLAELVGISSTRIQEIEQGINFPEEANFYQNLRKLPGVSEWEIFLLLTTSGASDELGEAVFPPKHVLVLQGQRFPLITLSDDPLTQEEIESHRRSAIWQLNYEGNKKMDRLLDWIDQFGIQTNKKPTV